MNASTHPIHSRLTPVTPMPDDPEAWYTHSFDLQPKPSDAPAMLEREWILTNGAGSFAMGTLPGVNTRRYHGLLVAATHPPVGRILAVNQLFERLVLSDPAHPEMDQTLEFTAFHFRDPSGYDHFSPRGDFRLVKFEKGLDVRWTYRWGDVVFQRTLSLAWKQAAATVSYRITGLKSQDLQPRLFVSPMVSLRDFHHICKRYYQPLMEVSHEDNLVAIRSDQRHVFLHAPGSTFTQSEEWWYDIFYQIEQERGSDCREDLFMPGWFEWNAGDQDQLDGSISFGITPDLARTHHTSEARRVALTPMFEHLDASPVRERRIMDTALRRQLVIAADDFVVDRTIRGKKLSTILAGYPWFADWGRDTFIALPGLLLETGRYEEAAKTLLTFSHAMRRGLVPNRFDDYDDQRAHYNTVDGSLWFVISALRYLDRSGDRDLWKQELAPACGRVLDSYLHGTDGPIQADDDGLIMAGNHATQLTWMDAKCNNVIFTPRFGKAVEINALWYQALVGMARQMEEIDWNASVLYRDLASKVVESFIRVFWNQEAGYLHDTVWRDDHGHWHADLSLRPNQIFAAAFEDSPLPREMRLAVTQKVRDKLLTPVGLRTLPTDDSRYHGHYFGDGYQRDEAYHQGVVWPWLIGGYAEAVLRAGEFSKQSREEAIDAISGLLEFMDDQGIGQLHEIHEGNLPHRPVGCPAQAWSVAEVLRIARLIELAPVSD